MDMALPVSYITEQAPRGHAFLSVEYRLAISSSAFWKLAEFGTAGMTVLLAEDIDCSIEGIILVGLDSQRRMKGNLIFFPPGWDIFQKNVRLDFKVAGGNPMRGSAREGR
jgi:hypothetical protein